VTAYDIRFRPAGSWWIQGYRKIAVNSPATTVLLTRENGLNPLTTYEFEVRARNDHCEGEWSKVSIYIAPVPGPVQNLRFTQNTHSLRLNWDKPRNAEMSVTAYDIRFKQSRSLVGDGYSKMTVNASTTSVLLTEAAAEKV